MKKKKGKEPLRQALFNIESHIELFSNKEVYIDGCCGVIEYSEDKIRLDIGDKIITFKGDKLLLGEFTLNQTNIKGDIISIEFSD